MNTDLVLEITTNKDQYRIGEGMIVRLYLFNFSDDPILANSRMALNAAHSPGEVSFQVVGPAEKSLPFRARVNIGKPVAEHFSTIIPWNCVGRQYDYVQTYFQIDKAGQYRLTATYRNESSGKETGMEAWTGTLTSNTVAFAIT